MDLEQLRSQRVGLLCSGGLSCTTTAAWLADSGVDTICYVADLGQRVPLPPTELAGLLRRQGLKAQIVDLRAELADLYADMLCYQASYEGGYWNTTGAARAVLVAGLVAPLRADGCTVLGHGCVGGGNDQARFARYAAALAPDLAVFAPWASSWTLARFPGRREMADYLRAAGFPAAITEYADYSVDGNLGGFSHESAALEALDTPSDAIRPLLTTRPQQAPDEVEHVEVRFERGRVVSVRSADVGAVSGSSLEILLTANQIGGRNGLSIRTVVENRVNGTKCRGMYEAPGLDLLGQCAAALHQVSLDRTSAALMRDLSYALGRAVYEGRLYEPTTLAARAAADHLTSVVTGTVRVGVYKGNVLFEGVTDLAHAPGTARQTRFSNGGNAWHITD